MHTLSGDEMTQCQVVRLSEKANCTVNENCSIDRINQQPCNLSNFGLLRWVVINYTYWLRKVREIKQWLRTAAVPSSVQSQQSCILARWYLQVAMKYCCCERSSVNLCMFPHDSILCEITLPHSVRCQHLYRGNSPWVETWTTSRGNPTTMGCGQTRWWRLANRNPGRPQNLQRYV